MVKYFHFRSVVMEIKAAGALRKNFPPWEMSPRASE
jgi:hypothetical protein